mgnify:CR=1 FL=1
MMRAFHFKSRARMLAGFRHDFKENLDGSSADGRRSAFLGAGRSAAVIENRVLKIGYGLSRARTGRSYTTEAGLFRWNDARLPQSQIANSHYPILNRSPEADEAQKKSKMRPCCAISQSLVSEATTLETYAHVKKL